MISRIQNLMAKRPDHSTPTRRTSSWDTLFVIVGFRADTTPMLRRWPIDEKSSTAAESIPGWKKRRPKPWRRSASMPLQPMRKSRRPATKLRAACHPDQSHDEADRVMREARSKDVNVAIDTLLKKVGRPDHG